MPKRVTIKNHVQEIALISRRCIVALILMLGLMCLLILRLSFLQLSQHTLYTTLSKKNWLDIIPIEPTRGLIYDRNGVLLAENIPVFSLDILPYKITNYAQTLAELAKLIELSDTDIAQFQKALKEHRRFDEIPLKLRLSEAEVARFYENQYRFPAALIKARLIRYYPQGPTFSHVLGYVGRINMDELESIDANNYAATNYIGKLGIEKFYEDLLHGTVGYEEAENDVSGQALRTLNHIKPIPGKDLYLTLDSRLQKVAETALAGSRGAVVVLQPSTGEVLAMVSTPAYDPNAFVLGISGSDFQALQQSPDRPLYNRALRGLYPLASTIKPYIALAGLESGVTNPTATIFDPGWYQLPGVEHRYHDWRHHGHGTVNVSLAIISSCDTYFFDLAHRLGIQRIDNLLTSFGFGSLTGIDVGEELPGTVPTPAWKRRVKGQPWYEGDTIVAGIGQGFMQATPLQLAAGVATIANHGQRTTPHLLRYTAAPGKAPEYYRPAPPPPVTLTNPDAWPVVINAMQGVITSPFGTGILHFGKPPPYSVAGKSGTAQVFTIKHYEEDHDYNHQENLPERLRDHSLFIAFAPVDHPQVAVAVLVENSKLAPGVARQILDYYFLGTEPVPPVPPAAGVTP